MSLNKRVHYLATSANSHWSLLMVHVTEMTLSIFLSTERVCLQDWLCGEWKGVWAHQPLHPKQRRLPWTGTHTHTSTYTCTHVKLYSTKKTIWVCTPVSSFGQLRNPNPCHVCLWIKWLPMKLCITFSQGSPTAKNMKTPKSLGGS